MNYARRLCGWLGLTCVFAGSSFAVTPPTALSDYYLHYEIPGQPFQSDSLSRRTTTPPDVRVYGGGIDPAPITTSAGQFWVVDRLVTLSARSTNANGLGALQVFGPTVGPCRYIPTAIAQPLFPGYTVTEQAQWYARPPSNCIDSFTPPPPRWVTTDVLTFGAPVRRKTASGATFEASPMTVIRNGVPWMTYYWGYRLGLVESQSDWIESNRASVPALADWPSFPNSRDNFSLTALPPPQIDGEIVEFQNAADFPASPSGQFFYATTLDERLVLDASNGWKRTGRSFKSGGYVTVCRLHTGTASSPNSFIFSADADECTALRALPQLTYDGQIFSANLPMPSPVAAQTAVCPPASIPLYRAYNNASGKGYKYGSNHRFATNRQDIATMVRDGWLDEGMVMCVPG